MMVNDLNNLASHINHLLEGWQSAFPYIDAKKVLAKAEQGDPKNKQRYIDLIPDLDSYFYNVFAHAKGNEEFAHWSFDRMRKAREQIKPSFFELHKKYQPLEWMINQIDTPGLYKKMELSNQLRKMLIAIFDQRIFSDTQANLKRQEQVFIIS